MNKSSVVAVKPFPWRCRECKKLAIWPAVVTHSIDIEYDGRVEHVVIKDLQTPQCRECQAVFPDGEANQQITLAFLRQAKLLTPQEIRGHREALGLTPMQMAMALGISDATMARWEKGAQIQPRSLDNLLRIFFGFPEVRKQIIDNHLSDLALVTDPAECQTVS